MAEINGGASIFLFDFLFYPKNMFFFLFFLMFSFLLPAGSHMTQHSPLRRICSSPFVAEDCHSQLHRILDWFSVIAMLLHNLIIAAACAPFVDLQNGRRFSQHDSHFSQPPHPRDCRTRTMLVFRLAASCACSASHHSATRTYKAARDFGAPHPRVWQQNSMRSTFEKLRAKLPCHLRWR